MDNTAYKIMEAFYAPDSREMLIIKPLYEELSNQLQKKLEKELAGAVTEMPSVASINNNSGDLNSFERVIGSTKVQSKGLFNIYRSGEKYYWEIPDSMLNREMLAVTRMVKAFDLN